MAGRERSREEESKSVVLEKSQVKYPFRGILKESVEDNGAPENSAVLGVQCLLTCHRL